MNTFGVSKADGMVDLGPYIKMSNIYDRWKNNSAKKLRYWLKFTVNIKLSPITNLYSTSKSQNLLLQLAKQP